MIIKDLREILETTERMYDSQYFKDPSDYHVNERIV